ncbi:MAG: methylenetetrahydrofolate reductase [NAD(P)H] [Flavobacteriales bacterium]|nr:methylenetetrahydrofolate reductase [NAD(P)H] [Flavobacteriales bacterium]
MKVTDHIKKAKKSLFSLEILPPLKGKGIQSIYDGIDPLIEFGPAFVNVTYHREEFVYKKREKGYLEKISIKKRPGTVGICAAIVNKYKVDAIPHIICGGFTKEETENALIDLNFLGIDNVLLLRGDPIKTEPAFIPEEDGHHYAVDLVKQVVGLNNGEYMDEDLQNATPTNFNIGVAGYPEKHFEAPNMKNDIKYLKQKIDAGAEYIVTQLFYDNQKFKDFVNTCRENGITVPIIPGIKPISTKKQLLALPKFFHIDLPDELVDAIESAPDADTVKQVGIDWAIKQSKDLIDFGVPCIHYYTMGKSLAVREVVKAVFGS